MKRIELDELKSIQVEILSKVHSYCVENNIRYSLTAGTLLGAIRHKGYIPWDDDIDIAMPRPDYDRFLNGFNGAYPDLYVIAPELNWNFYAPYANVCDNRTVLYENSNGHRGIEMGIKIDIFPIDGVPEDESVFIYKLNRINLLNSIMWNKRRILKRNSLKNIKSTLKSILIKVLYICRSYSSFQKELHRIVISHPYEESQYAQCWVFSVYNGRFKKTMFEEYIDLSFEGRQFKAIKDYAVWLTALYGDYMQLPPIKKRVGHHNFKAYWKD